MGETIGLDIGSSSIKLVGLRRTSKGYFLSHIGIREITHGTGREDTASIAKETKALFSELGIRPGKVVLAVSGAGVTAKRLILPSMPYRELREAVRWELKDQLPFPMESAQVDCYLLQERVEGSVKKAELIAVACPIDLIERTLAIAEEVGLRVGRLDIAPFALWNTLLCFGPGDRSGTIALLDVGAEKTGLHVFKSGQWQFSREMTPAGSDFTEAILEALQENADIPSAYERAESLKREMGIPVSPDSKTEERVLPFAKVSFQVRPVMERLVSEIRRSLDYYRSQSPADRLDRIVLTGGSALLKNLAISLEKELRIPVELFNPLRGLLHDPKRIESSLLDQIGPLFSVAAGLALEGPHRIDFLARREPWWSKLPIEKTVPLFSSFLTLIVFVGLVWHMNGQTAALKRERDAKAERLRTIEELQTRLQRLKEKEGQIRSDLSVLPSPLGAPISISEVLRSVGQVVPENVTITLLSIQETGRGAKEGKELEMKGLAFGGDQQCLLALSRILEAIEESPLFEKARLQSAHEIRGYNQPATEFEIICPIRRREDSTKEGASSWR